jgi:hypothetical protein
MVRVFAPKQARIVSGSLSLNLFAACREKGGCVVMECAVFIKDLRFAALRVDCDPTHFLKRARESSAPFVGEKFIPSLPGFHPALQSPV